MWLFLLINMMTTAGNSSSNVINADNNDNVFIVNSNTHVNSIDDNSHDYFSFDMSLVLSYMNSQLIYYFIFDTILAAEQAHFQQLMKQRKTFLALLEWDNISDNNESDISQEDSIIFINVNNNSDYSASLSDHKSIKINLLNILKLAYNNIITQYNN